MMFWIGCVVGFVVGALVFAGGMVLAIYAQWRRDLMRKDGG